MSYFCTASPGVPASPFSPSLPSAPWYIKQKYSLVQFVTKIRNVTIEIKAIGHLSYCEEDHYFVIISMNQIWT